jgi:hypothetical protein
VGKIGPDDTQRGYESGYKKKVADETTFNSLILLIGAIGFEPTTSRSRTTWPCLAFDLPILSLFISGLFSANYDMSSRPALAPGISCIEIFPRFRDGYSE